MIYFSSSAQTLSFWPTVTKVITSGEVQGGRCWATTSPKESEVDSPEVDIISNIKMAVLSKIMCHIFTMIAELKLYYLWWFPFCHVGFVFCIAVCKSLYTEKTVFAHCRNIIWSQKAILSYSCQLFSDCRLQWLGTVLHSAAFLVY